MARRSAPALLAMLTLAGCQTLPVVPDDLHFDDPAALEQWDLRARMGYRSVQDSGSATLDWTQRHEEGQIRFSGPMGLGGARLDWDTHEATLDTGREQVTATTPAELAWRLTGLWLPVEALQYWVRGLPWPNARAEALHDENGRLQELRQLGWELHFDRYETVAGLELPHRIRASHGDDRFTLIVHDWRPQP